ncbi:MAG: hypothetical protein J6O04_06805 [Selenomonadaceae bacterium]|nr:hypothetical protein [Selenomonadaceae bacterium]
MTCPLKSLLHLGRSRRWANDGYWLLMSRIMIVISVKADKYKNSYLFISTTSPFLGAGTIS